VAENQPNDYPVELEDTYEDEANQNRDKSRKSRNASREQTRYWRRVPSVNVLPGEKKQLPANFLMRSVLVVAIGLLVLVSVARYLDWHDFEKRAETSLVLSQSVQGI